MATRRTPGTRAKDSDRTDTCQVLDGALADGQLSMAEHQQRVSAATKATTLGELHALVADLQSPQPLLTPPAASRRRPIVITALAGLVVLIGAAAAWTLTSGDESTSAVASPTASSGTHEPHALAAAPTTSDQPADPPPIVLAPPANLQSAEGLSRVIDEIRKRFGDTMGYELAVMSDEAVLARPDPSAEGSKLIYTFHGGWGDPSTRSRSDTDELTDLGAFDVPAAAAAIQNAPQTLQISPGDVAETSVDVDASPTRPGPARWNSW